MSLYLLTFFVLLQGQAESDGRTYTMFTWVPGYEELSGRERDGVGRTEEEWMVSIHAGTFEVQVDPEQLRATGRAFTEVKQALQELPEGSTVYWHVGWWSTSRGRPTPSEFFIPSNEMKRAVEAAAEELGLEFGTHRAKYRRAARDSGHAFYDLLKMGAPQGRHCSSEGGSHHALSA